MVVSLFAKCIAIDETDDYWLVGFSDEEYQTREYLTLTRSREDDETYHVERNDQLYSCYGGIQRLVLHRDRAVITLNTEGVKRLAADTMEIAFSIDDARFEQLKQTLREVFAKTECLEIAG